MDKLKMARLERKRLKKQQCLEEMSLKVEDVDFCPGFSYQRYHSYALFWPYLNNTWKGQIFLHQTIITNFCEEADSQDPFKLQIESFLKEEKNSFTYGFWYSTKLDIKGRRVVRIFDLKDIEKYKNKLKRYFLKNIEDNLFKVPSYKSSYKSFYDYEYDILLMAARTICSQEEYDKLEQTAKTIHEPNKQELERKEQEAKQEEQERLEKKRQEEEIARLESIEKNKRQKTIKELRIFIDGVDRTDDLAYWSTGPGQNYVHIEFRNSSTPYFYGLSRVRAKILDVPNPDYEGDK